MKANFFHKLNDKILFRGNIYYIYSRGISVSGNKCYQIRDENYILVGGGVFIREAFTMKYFDFESR